MIKHTPAPHECDDPKCPGNINRKKLAIYDGIVKSLIEYTNETARGGIISLGMAMRAHNFLEQAEAIERGE